MTPASQPHVVRLRSGDLVRVRQGRPGDAPTLVQAYAHPGEQSRYRRSFTVMPELPEATLRAPTGRCPASFEEAIVTSGWKDGRPRVTIPFR
jgi:hypothetical protein